MTATAELGFVHRWLPATGALDRTLLLLHGTGGTEDDLLPLGRALLPGAALLSPRGPVLELGMPRFFRRLADGVFDLDDLCRRTDDLAAFVDAAAGRYGFARDRVVAVGFSNGANIAASLLLRHGAVLADAVLLRAMVPFEPEATPALDGVRALLRSGRSDPIVPVAQPDRLAGLLRAGGAAVRLDWVPAGHGLVQADVDAARDWLAAG